MLNMVPSVIPVRRGVVAAVLLVGMSMVGATAYVRHHRVRPTYVRTMRSAPCHPAPCARPPCPYVTARPCPPPPRWVNRWELGRGLHQPVLVPVARNGMPVGRASQLAAGLKVYEAHASSLEKMGVRDGDIIVAVNWQPLHDADQLWRAFVGLRHMPMPSDYSLSILRNGHPMVLRFLI